MEVCHCTKKEFSSKVFFIFVQCVIYVASKSLACLVMYELPTSSLSFDCYPIIFLILQKTHHKKVKLNKFNAKAICHQKFINNKCLFIVVHSS